MLILILFAILSIAAIAATLHEVRIDGYGRVRTDALRVPDRD
ncbi:hypothetical protein [Microbacterium sp.]|nr:hypothetical protein [Microbacterium sp.]